MFFRSVQFILSYTSKILLLRTHSAISLHNVVQILIFVAFTLRNSKSTPFKLGFQISTKKYSPRELDTFKWKQTSKFLAFAAPSRPPRTTSNYTPICILSITSTVNTSNFNLNSPSTIPRPLLKFPLRMQAKIHNTVFTSRFTNQSSKVGGVGMQILRDDGEYPQKRDIDLCTVGA